jgi:hypothetical protein
MASPGSGYGHFVGYARAVRRAIRSASSARHDAAEQERADCRHHERQDRQRRADNADDGQHKADDANQPRNAAANDQLVRTPLALPSGGIAAALL